ncbi:Adenylate cyclase type 10 (AH-related protein) (Adenylate cyclase homolog) (Germ cell soluble adenylyl cyclase) (hsAC) (sAC) (Testicular soluble adenylyl cyclase) [Durusdinium trenchii]|uniref:Adenylate cyclase type 10 (AH-related protein) (Adenylate cyclase homolog) (Germ cell soluble adenylyl cyclase) (HsAC) (SAC) (Testicular soluble adenylyl cyclase) n=1 Tax=Durusdinium trenchii TaxID=1381693 RepID=A0ABP0KCN5_9DINO
MLRKLRRKTPGLLKSSSRDKGGVPAGVEEPETRARSNSDKSSDTAGVLSLTGSRGLDDVNYLENRGDDALSQDEVAFLCRGAREYVSRHAADRKPRMFEREGVVLLVDISGFTRLGTDLAERFSATSAAEDFAKQTIETLNYWTRVCYEWGGDVVKFAGDALLCTWTTRELPKRSSATEPVTLEDLYRLANRAALEMLQHFGSPSGDGDEDGDIAMHGGIGVGSINELLLCNENGGLRWHLVAGQAVDDAAALLDRAERGEILSALDAGFATNNRFWSIKPKMAPTDNISLFQTTQDVRVIADLDDLTGALVPSAVRAFIPKQLRGRLHGFRANGGEMRRCTIMFVSLPEVVLAADPDQDTKESWLGDFNDMFMRVSQIVHESHGELRDLLFDDKGCMYIAVFGAYKNIENCELWAVRAARSIHAMSPGSTIGLSGGMCYAGLCGSPARHDFVVMGQDVNMASRFMAGAQPGQIMVGISVMEASESFYKYQPMTITKEKATYTETHKGFVLEGKLRRKRRSTINLEGRDLFVGRSVETSLVQNFVQAVEAQPGSMGLVTIEGEPGIGKTSMVKWIRRAMPWRSLYALCETVEHDAPYHVMRQYVERCTGLRDNYPDNELVMLLDKLDQDGISLAGLVVLCPYLERLESGDEEGALYEAPTDPAERLHVAADALIALFQRNRGDDKCLLVFNEDACWMDTASTELMLEMFKRKAELEGLVFLLTFRNDPDVHEMTGDWFKRIEEAKRLVGLQTRLRLETLRFADVEELVKGLFLREFDRIGRTATLTPARMSMIWGAIIGEQGNLLENPLEVHPDIQQLIFRKTQGNPKNIVNKVQWLVQKRFVTRKNGKVVYMSPHKKIQAEQQSPESLLDVILGRFDNLSDDKKGILKIAACMGEEFDAKIIWKVATKQNRNQSENIDFATFLETLQTLSTAGFIKVKVVKSKNKPGRSRRSKNRIYEFQNNAILQSILNLVPSSLRETNREMIAAERHGIAAFHLNVLDEVLGTG